MLWWLRQKTFLNTPGQSCRGGYRKEEGDNMPAASDFRMEPDGESRQRLKAPVIAGSLKMMKSEGVFFPASVAEHAEEFLKKGSTVIYAAIDGKAAGYIVLSDTIREESPAMIAALKKMGAVPVLLTGDHQNAAQAISCASGIDTFHAQCLPQDKLSYIDSWQQEGMPVCMIGDGINDAPALKSQCWHRHGRRGRHRCRCG